MLSLLMSSYSFVHSQAGLYNTDTRKGCTNHGIRKTAAQWCGRCNGRIVDAKNNGRWKSVEELAHYLSQGAVDRQSNTERGHKDPIWGIWVWKPVTLSGVDGKDQM